MSNPARQPSPRAYPRGLGDCIHKIYVEQLRGPAHGDLRVRIVPDRQKNESQLFADMSLGDIWEEADLKPVFDFLMKCKHTRTISMHTRWREYTPYPICRIPHEFQQPMEQLGMDWALGPAPNS